MRYLNLYVQTEYSLLSSYVKVDDYINYGVNNKIPALSISDDNTYALYKFYKKCKDNNIKPVLGLRLNISEDNYLLLYAYNNTGYTNLLKLSSLSMMGEKIDESLNGYSGGIIVVLPYLESEIIREYQRVDFISHLNHLKTIYDYFYVGIELPLDSSDKKWIEIDSICHDNGIDTLLLNKTLYLNRNDFEYYEVLRKIALNNNKLELDSYYKNCYFKNDIVISSVLIDRPYLVNNLSKVEELCNVCVDDSGYKFPYFDKSGEKVPNDYLATLAKMGLNKRLKGQNVDLDLYRNRLLYELDVIDKMGFNDYFLIVYDYVKYAKTHGILVGPGRGSAAGSLVSYAIGITNIDPIKFDLLFERFLNPERSSMPDIDVDFPSYRREDVISYISSRYGNNRVAHLNAFATLKQKSALKYVGDALGIDSKRVSILSNYIAEKNPSSLKVIYETNNDVKRICESDEDLDKLFRIAIKLEDIPHHITTHASGIVIAPDDLTKYTGIQRGPNGIMQTQYEADDIGAVGLVKMDVLGLINLDTIESIINNIYVRTGKKVDFYNIPLNDKETFTLLSKVDTDGVFQLESAGMKKTIGEVGIDSFSDIYDVLSLFRPGPMDYIPEYTARKHGKKYSLPSEKLIPILKPTYGIIVYQEQIMQIANTIASYSLGEADILRRGVSKKKEDILLKEKEKFISRGKANNYSEEFLTLIYNDIVKFAGYGFNKSHAVAYAYISCALAYFKTHYLGEFSAALMDNAIGNETKLNQYILACKNCGITIVPPDINISSYSFVTVKDKIYFPLSAIASIGVKTCQDIIDVRREGPFKDFEDFVSRTLGLVNKKSVLMLIYAGCFDSFNITRKSAQENYENIVLRCNFKNNNVNLKPLEYTTEEFSFSDIAEYERCALKMNLKFNEFIKYKPLYEAYKAVDLNTLMSSKNSGGIIIAKVSKMKEITTKKNTLMCFINLNDESYSCEGVMFNDEYVTLKNKIKEGSICLLQVDVKVRDNVKSLVIKNAKDITI